MVTELSSNPLNSEDSLLPDIFSLKNSNGLEIESYRSTSSFQPALPLNNLNFNISNSTQVSSQSPFTSGVFKVGSTGQVGIDYLFDGGGYEGELAIFSLEDLGALGFGTSEFIQEIARRALSDSILGHVVISDQTEGARFSGELPWEGDFNAGDYLGGRTFAMRPGDTFGVMLVPNGTVQQIFETPNAEGALRPLFSLVSVNPNSASQFGQIADVDGNGRTFTMEDLRLDGESDRDYNDIIFQVRGATGQAVSLDQLIDPNKDWRNLDIGQALLNYAAAYDDPKTVQPVDYNFPQSSQPLIGIIDTGFSANNPDIDYSHLILGSDRIGNDNNPLLAPSEGNEHGTHILGIIGATQNNGIGIDGINDEAPIWLGRAIGSGQWADSLVEFVNQALKSNQPHAVVNLSLDLTQINPDGTVTTRYEFTPQERAALEYARQSGVLIVAAAGNNGGVMSVLGQASQEFDNIITVGAADGFNRADYSSYGEGLDILAEGNDALSTVGDGVGTLTGTSVATAKVTGAISQIWAANPGLSYRQVIEIVKATATDLNTPGWDTETGAGLLNLEAAVNLAKVTEPQAYAPAAFNTPTTWSGADLVTPTERAVNQQNVGTLTGTQVFNGALTTTNTEDTYQFFINTPSSFKLNLSGFSSLINAQLFKDSSLVTAGSSSLEYALLQPGNYTVKLQSAVPGAGTNYTLNLVAQNLAQDLGTITSSRTINDAVSNSTPYRYYQFTLANNSIFTSTFSGSPSTSYAKLLDSNYRPIGGSNPSTLNAGTYYIEVASLGGVSTNYSLNLQATPTTRWDNAGNYREAALNVGNLNGNQTFSDFLDNTDTTDFYRFNLATNSVFNLDLSSLGDSVFAILYDAQGNTAASGDNRTSSQSLINRTLNAGTYYVQLYRDLVNSSLSYNLNFSATPLAPADNAGNSPALARNIGDLYPNQPQSFSDAIGDSDPADYYRLNLPVRGDLQLQLNGLNASADLGILKLEANGTTVDYGGINSQNQSQATVTLNDLPVGTYLVKVSPSASGSNTNYTLNLATTATNVAPSNLQINLSGIYSSNQDLYVTGRVYDPNGGGDLDKVWLQFNGRDYYITNFTPSAQGSQWAEFSYNLGRVVPGIYGWAARAYDKSGSFSGMTLSNNSVQVVNAPVDTAGETPQTARDFGIVNQPISIGEFVGTVDRADVYKFTVPPTASGNSLSMLSFQLSGLSGDADFSVYQILGNGAKVSVNSPTYGTGTKTFTDQFLPGTYFVEVYTRDGSVNTNYNLRITPPTVGTLQVGQTLSGSLATTDSRDPNRSTFYDDYTLAGFTPGQRVRVTVNSSGFIPQLFLLEATTGQVTAQSTVITNGNSTELEFTVPTDWNNRIRVTSQEQNATGSYTLSTAMATSNGGNNTFTLGTDAIGNTYPAFTVAGQYYGVYGVPTSAVYRAGNGYIQEMQGLDGFGKYYLMFEDGASKAFLIGGDLLTYYVNNGGVGRFGYPTSEVKVDPAVNFNTQYFRNGHLVMHDGRVYGYNGPEFDLRAGFKLSSQTGRVNTSVGLNYRSQPSASAPTLDNALPFGTTFTIIQKVNGGSYNTGSSTRNDWYEIEYNGKRGYVAAAFVEVLGTNQPVTTQPTMPNNQPVTNVLIRTGSPNDVLNGKQVSILDPGFDTKEKSSLTVWTIIKPEAGNEGKKHLVTINWGAYQWNQEVTIGKDGIALKYLKKANDSEIRFAAVQVSQDTEGAKLISNATSIVNVSGDNPSELKGITDIKVINSDWYNGPISPVKVWTGYRDEETDGQIPDASKVAQKLLLNSNRPDSAELKNNPDIRDLASKLTSSSAAEILFKKEVPLASGYLDPFNDGTYHTGFDMGFIKGTEVKALVGGTVINAGGGSGSVAIHNEEMKKTFLYLHMDNMKVQKGSVVTAGTVIGEVSNVGADDVHLHFEVQDDAELASLIQTKPSSDKPTKYLDSNKLEFYAIPSSIYRNTKEHVAARTYNPLNAFLEAKARGLTMP